MKHSQKNKQWKHRETAALYGSLILFCLATDLLLLFPLMPNLGENPAVRSAAPITPRSARDPLDYTGFPAPADSALGWPQGRIPNANFAPVNYSGLPSVTSISQTVDGYVVTLYPMYANANLIVMTYTVKSLYEDLTKLSPGQRLIGEDPAGAYEPRLKSETGRNFPWLHYSLFQNPGFQNRRDYVGALLVFDARKLAESVPTELKLHLELNKLQVWLPVFGDSYAPQMRMIRGPVSFDFSMPVDHVHRVADLQQSATTRDGDIITIEKVIATRHDVRVVWRVERRKWFRPSYSAPVAGYVCCRVRLRVGDKSGTFRPLDNYETAVGDHVMSGSFFNEEGEWAISAWYSWTWITNADPPDTPGPVFRFTMPPAQIR